MSKSTATIALNGEVILADFASAVSAFSQLFSSLSKEVAKDAKAEWIVDSLEISSAIATVRGVSTADPDDDESIERVINAYEEVGRAAQDRIAIPYGTPVRNSLTKLLGLVNGRISSIRFETPEFDAEIFSPLAYGADSIAMKVETVRGAAQGRIQSMTNRGGLRFTLYDSIDDHAISCYLTAGSEEIMRNAWGRLAVVEGLIRRNPITGLVSTIREVSMQNVLLLKEGAADEWREAIGCAPAVQNSISPEEAIRRMRDG